MTAEVTRCLEARQDSLRRERLCRICAVRGQDNTDFSG
jgi:hypothetical protein